MLIAFFKSHDDRSCDCEIAKFVDRIWIEKTGDLVCIRTFIIYVKEKSEPLNGIRMLVPFRDVLDSTDLSHTCLDEKYLLNAGSLADGGYEIQTVDPEKTHGTVSYDFFKDVEVTTKNLNKAFPAPKTSLCTVIAIDFPQQPIRAGQFRLIRCQFKITSVLDKLFTKRESKTYTFEQWYFAKALYSKDFAMLDITNLEVPVNKWYNPETKQGGFDIFLYLSEGMEGRRFNSDAETISRYRPDGTKSEENAQKLIWRARLKCPEKVKYLKAEKTSFSIQGYIEDPYLLEGIRKAVADLKRAFQKSKKWIYIALIISILSFIAMLVGRDWIISNVDKVSNWVKELIV